jgi:hypothetical protein
MRSLLRLLPALLLAVFLSLSSGADDKPAVTLKSAKLTELDKLIKESKGKVVLVDIWSTT